MEGDDWSAQDDHSLLHDRRAHQIQPTLVLRSSQKKYWRTRVGGLIDLVKVVNDSVVVKVAQPTAREDGTVLVTTYD